MISVSKFQLYDGGGGSPAESLLLKRLGRVFLRVSPSVRNFGIAGAEVAL